jgi:hypothetical protein
MNVAKYLSICFVTMTFLYACETPKIAQKTEIVDSDDLIIKLIDSVDFSSLRMDTSGDGLFGRKIIFREMRFFKATTYESGIIQVKFCINREGIVKYVEIQRDRTTIKNINTLKSYLKGSAGYKFQPSSEAPEYECGKITFRIDNSRNNRLR